MEKRSIEVSIDTFARIWAARLPGEKDEDQVLARILSSERPQAERLAPAAVAERAQEGLTDFPPSKKWTDLLIWALKKHGGRAALSDIYKTSRQGRLALGFRTTRHHDDAARECLESHCRESSKFKGTELFYMPEGKGAGIWALVAPSGTRPSRVR
jgi:hypothetical protein